MIFSLLISIITQARSNTSYEKIFGLLFISAYAKIISMIKTLALHRSVFKLLFMSLLAAIVLAICETKVVVAASNRTITVRGIDISMTSKSSFTYLENNSISEGGVPFSCNNIRGSSAVDGLVNGVDPSDGVSEIERLAMLHNAWYLQQLISCAPRNQELKIALPIGDYYFASGHSTMSDGSRNEHYFVLWPKNGVSIAGVAENRTILHPYSSGVSADMFFFDEYTASKNTDDKYLSNVNFSDLTIDGAYAGDSADGFHLNLVENLTLDNVTVRNVGETGFYIGSPIGSTISNSKATNCGSAADDNTEGSGFVIGTGYSSSEGLTITSSEADNNASYGFVFEHQNRSNGTAYQSNNGNFIIQDSYATNNAYNYGGRRAVDVTYSNLVSTSGNDTVLDIFVDDESRNISINNVSFGDSRVEVFKDLVEGNYYYNAVQWAERYGITNGVAKNSFGTNDTIKRGDALILIWRMASNRQGVNLNVSTDGEATVETGFADVTGDEYYANAISWGKANGVVNGYDDGLFHAERGITRAEFVTMLYNLSPSKSSGGLKYYFNDVQKAR